jgi:DNA-binding transcriptional MocR family regulator
MTEDLNKPFPLYQMLVHEFSALIMDGSLKPGERLPSVRRLASQRKVSISTALQALRSLENRNLVEARPQAGYFVRHRPRALEEPAITRPSRVPRYVGIADMVAQVRAAALNPHIVPLGTASPAAELFPAQRFQRIASRVARHQPKILTTYGFSSGNPAFTHQLTRRYLEWGVTIAEAEIIVTHGCTEAMGLALRAVTAEGDTVALESPAYYGTLQILESLKLKVIEIPTHPRDGISLEALDVAVSHHEVKAVIVSANASNPLGATMSDERKRVLVGKMEGHSIPVIEDDIYGDLPFEACRPLPLKAFERKGGVLHCSSFSKTLAPGLRIGWVVPGRYLARVAQLKYINTLTTPEFPQLILAEFLAEGGYDHHLRKIRRAFANQVRQMTEAVTVHFPEGTKVTRPRGGFVVWVELPCDVDTMELYGEGVARGFSFAPGRLFSSTDRYRYCLRLSCGHPWSSKREQAVVELGKLVKNRSGRL